MTHFYRLLKKLTSNLTALCFSIRFLKMVSFCNLDNSLSIILVIGLNAILIAAVEPEPELKLVHVVR